MKNKKEKKYKVVYKKWPRELWSAGYVGYASNVQKVRYYVGKWVEAKFGGLLVFDLVSNARNFISSYTGLDEYPIYECEVDEKVNLPMFRIFSNNWWIPFFTYTELWEQKELPKLPSSACYFSWHEGTEAYKRVKLLKRVR